MEYIRSITCPNCGAQAKNLRNCEYCGSLLVRFVDKQISITPQTEFIYAGLVEALEQNIKMQKSVFKNQVVVTDIGNGYCCFAQVISAHVLEAFGNNLNPALAIDLTFFVNSRDVRVAQEERNRLTRFKSSSIYELFTKVELENTYCYQIDFGEDSNGAALILSKYFTEVENYPKDATLCYNTTITTVP